MKQTFAKSVREAMQELGTGGREMTIIEIARKLDLVSTNDKKPLHCTLKDFRDRGEVKRIEEGVYRYVGRKKKNEIQRGLWRVLRKNGTVTKEHLLEVTEAAENTVSEFLNNLVRLEVARKHKNGKYQLIKDSVEMPPNDYRAEKLRRVRERKKEAREALARAREQIDLAEKAIDAIDEDV